MVSIKGNYYTNEEEVIPVPASAGAPVDHYLVPLVCGECGGRMEHVNASKSFGTSAAAVAKCTQCGESFTVHVQMRKLPKKS